MMLDEHVARVACAALRDEGSHAYTCLVWKLLQEAFTRTLEEGNTLRTKAIIRALHVLGFDQTSRELQRTFERWEWEKHHGEGAPQ